MGEEQIQPAGGAPPRPAAPLPGAAPAPPVSPPPPVKKKTTLHQPKDITRDLVEFVVFIVIVVLFLKTFVAEQFVIPTGSMATTLLGAHKTCECEQCGYRFRVNVSREVNPDEGPAHSVTSARCPNCEYANRLRPPMDPNQPGNFPEKAR